MRFNFDVTIEVNEKPVVTRNQTQDCGDSSPLFWCNAMHLRSAFCFHDPLHTCKMPSAYAYTSFASDLAY